MKFFICILMLITCSCNRVLADAELRAENQKLQAELNKIQEKQVADDRLGQYAINMMFKSHKTVQDLSPAHMQILARSIVRVADDIFDKEENKQAFIAVLQIESGFLRFSQSPTGPKGLMQIAQRTFHLAMKSCGVKDLKDDDVWETDLNLYAGACYFKEQLIKENGNIPAAMADYNQGPEDDAAKKYSKSGDLNKLEPLKYIAKYAYLNSTVTDQKEPGVPSIEELPKPKAPKETGKKK